MPGIQHSTFCLYELYHNKSVLRWSLNSLYSWAWSQTWCVAEDDLELLTFWLYLLSVRITGTCLQSWFFVCFCLVWVLVVLEIKPRILCMPGKHSTNWTISLAQDGLFLQNWFSRLVHIIVCWRSFVLLKDGWLYNYAYITIYVCTHTTFVCIYIYTHYTWRICTFLWTPG